LRIAPVERFHLRAVEAGKHLGRQRLAGVVVGTDDFGHALAEHLRGILSPVCHRRLELPFHQQERVRVIAGRREGQIEQLQRHLDGRRRDRSRNALAGQRDRWETFTDEPVSIRWRSSAFNPRSRRA
jgi:hypothetical protein